MTTSESKGRFFYKTNRFESRIEMLYTTATASCVRVLVSGAVRLCVCVQERRSYAFFLVRTHPLFEMNCLLLRLHPT